MNEIFNVAFVKSFLPDQVSNFFSGLNVLKLPFFVTDAAAK